MDPPSSQEKQDARQPLGAEGEPGEGQGPAKGNVDVLKTLLVKHTHCFSEGCPRIGDVDAGPRQSQQCCVGIKRGAGIGREKEEKLIRSWLVQGTLPLS